MINKLFIRFLFLLPVVFSSEPPAQDLFRLYFIAMRQAGETEAKAIERLTNFAFEMTAKLDYGSTKRMFAELITERFLENKGVKIM